MFEVGEQVVCVNDIMDSNKSKELLRFFENWICKGKIYTIREFLDNDGIVTGILLEEVHNTPKYFNLLKRFQEPAFALNRFAKINTKEEEEELNGIIEEILSGEIIEEKTKDTY